MPYRPTSNYRESLSLNAIPDATPTEDGVMSRTDKARLDDLVSGALTIVSRSADFAATVGTHYRVDTTSNDVTATLEAPSSANAGQVIELKKTSEANDMIVTTSALIDGVVSESFSAQWQSVVLRSTGTLWDVVAY